MARQENSVFGGLFSLLVFNARNFIKAGWSLPTNESSFANVTGSNKISSVFFKRSFRANVFYGK
jgi:hypothetical protein